MNGSNHKERPSTAHQYSSLEDHDLHLLQLIQCLIYPWANRWDGDVISKSKRPRLHQSASYSLGLMTHRSILHEENI
jgi:hypothetical protein